jgi:hypothetical protein
MAKFRINGIPQSIRDMKTVSSASGAIATFDTDLTDNLVKCVANIQAVQSGTGTPSPDNVRSISGWQNVNVVKFAVKGNIPSDIRVYERWINQNINKWASSSNARSVAIPCQPNTTYTITGYSDQQTAYKFATIRISTLPDDNVTQYDVYQLAYFTGYSEVGKAYTFTTDSQATYIVIQLASAYADYFVENGTVAPSTLVTVSLGQTVFGGNLNVLSGVLTITHKGFDFGSVTWEKYTGRTYPIFRTEVSDIKIGTTGDFIVYSSCYEARGTSGSASFGDNVSNNLKICSQTSANRIMIMDNNVTGSADDFKTLRTGQTIVYELATPTTVQLSSNQIATLLQNNILADTGDIDVEFLETVGNKIA